MTYDFEDKISLEDKLNWLIQWAELPQPEREYRFYDCRRWRFDFAWPDVKVAAEVEGGTWTRGRHTRGRGFEKDCEKYNTATLLGWRVFRFTSTMVRDGRALDTLTEALRGEEG